MNKELSTLRIYYHHYYYYLHYFHSRIHQYNQRGLFLHRICPILLSPLLHVEYLAFQIQNY